MKKIFLKTFVVTSAVFMGIMSSYLLAISVSGTINTFSPGDQLDSAQLNENFQSLKSAIEKSSDINTNYLRYNDTINYTCTTTCYLSAFSKGSNGSMNVINESNITVIAPRSGEFKNLYGKCSGNLSSTVVITFRKNGTDSGLVLNVPAGTNGVVSNLTSSLLVNQGDEVSIKYTAASGSDGIATCMLSYEF